MSLGIGSSPNSSLIMIESPYYSSSLLFLFAPHFFYYCLDRIKWC